MTANSLNCKYLQINSVSYQELLLNGKLDSFTIKGTINKGTTFEEEINYPIPSSMWGINGMVISSDVSVTEFNVINIFTGQVINILTGPYTIASVSAVADFKAMIASRFLTLFSKVISQSSEIIYDSTTAVGFKYRIYALPYNIKPYSVKINTSGIISEKLFLPTQSGVGIPEPLPEEGVANLPDGLALDQNSIILLPEFFSLSAFENSVIHIELILVSSDGLSYTEQTCYFMDCDMKCSLSRIHNFECSDNGMHLAMLHYSLTQASNCDCDCDEMYEIFQYLEKKLNYLTNNKEGCGC